MLKIRLARGGRKKVPYYRIVVSNSTSPRDSKFIEKVGTYNPLLSKDDSARIAVQKDRVEYWLSVGAQPTEKVAKFLRDLSCKGAEKFQPSYVAKKKGEGLKKKALEKLQAEQEALEAKKAEEEAKKAEEKAAAEAEKEAAKADESAAVEEKADAEPEAATEEAKSE